MPPNRNRTLIGNIDSAGEIVEVGDKVTSVKIGQRVLVYCLGLATGKKDNAGFQLYTAAPAIVVAPIPDFVSFEEACVLPLSLSTASDGLFGKKWLALPYPQKNPKEAGSVLIWGGSSSVGSSAIQLAKAAGLKVVSTASKSNHEYVKSLGVAVVLDYNSPSIVEDLIESLKDGGLVGAYDAIGMEQSTRACADVVKKVLGKGMVASVLPPPENLPEGIESGQGKDKPRRHNPHGQGNV